MAAKEPGAAWNECHDVMDSEEGTSEQLHVTICGDHDMQLYEIMMNAASSLTASGFSAMVFHTALSQDRAYRSTELIQSTPEFKIKTCQLWGLLCSQETTVVLFMCYLCYLCFAYFMEEPIENVRVWQDSPCSWVAPSISSGARHCFQGSPCMKQSVLWALLATW